MAFTIKSAAIPGRIRLLYVERGDPSSMPVILLHGVTDSWRSFELVLPRLPGAVHAFAVTQRGHGDADRPATAYRARDFAADVAGFADALGLGPAVIVGHSMGGTNALRFVIDYPARTLGLVLVGSCASYRANPTVVEFWESTGSRLTDPIDPRFVREFQESTLAQPVPADFLDTVVKESLKVPVRVWRAVFEGLLQDDVVGELGWITAPTLIAWGDQDRFSSRGDQHALLGGDRGVVARRVRGRGARTALGGAGAFCGRPGGLLQGSRHGRRHHVTAGRGDARPDRPRTETAPASAISVERVSDLRWDAVETLVVESERAGLRFLRRLVDEWGSGRNRFDRPGEALFAARTEGRLVGVCGLNIDPYAHPPAVGRVRHLYVLIAHRRLGVGGRLVEAVVRLARGRFDTLRLRTHDPTAARLCGQHPRDGAALTSWPKVCRSSSTMRSGVSACTVWRRTSSRAPRDRSGWRVDLDSAARDTRPDA